MSLRFRYRDLDTVRAEIDWMGRNRIKYVFNADSNFGMASKALLQKLVIPPTRIHRMEAERPNREAAASEYQAELARLSPPSQGGAGGGDPPALDLVLLGMGPDGHTASLFPHTTALKETKRWVVANFVPKFNAHRLTMTAPFLNRASNVLFLVAGADKAPVLAEVLEGPPDHDRLPSQMIQPSAGTLTWFVDEAAAAKLTK